MWPSGKEIKLRHTVGALLIIIEPALLPLLFWSLLLLNDLRFFSFFSCYRTELQLPRSPQGYETVSFRSVPLRRSRWMLLLSPCRLIIFLCSVFINLHSPFIFCFADWQNMFGVMVIGVMISILSANVCFLPRYEADQSVVLSFSIFV